jgi:hypothetical protein
MTSYVGKLLHRAVLLASAMAMVMSACVASWWVVGDLTEVGWVVGDPTESVPRDLSYVVSPPEISPSIENALGAGALSLTVTMAFVALMALRAWGDAGYGRLLSLAGLLVIGVLLGLGFRVLTVGYTGATMAGLLIPPALAVVAATGVLCVVLVRGVNS